MSFRPTRRAVAWDEGFGLVTCTSTIFSCQAGSVPGWAKRTDQDPMAISIAKRQGSVKRSHGAGFTKWFPCTQRSLVLSVGPLRSLGHRQSRPLPTLWLADCPWSPQQYPPRDCGYVVDPYCVGSDRLGQLAVLEWYRNHRRTVQVKSPDRSPFTGYVYQMRPIYRPSFTYLISSSRDGTSPGMMTFVAWMPAGESKWRPPPRA